MCSDGLWESDVYLSTIDWTQYEVISLDLFDTVLFRACGKPIDVFQEVCKEAQRLNILSMSIQPFEFQQVRIAAEAKARTVSRSTRNHSEITLEEIYAQMPERFGKSHAHELMEVEIATEEKLCYLNLSMVSLINNCITNGSRIVFVSDMYLSVGQLWRILRKLGLSEEWIDLTLVSGEQGGDKSTGYLFDVLLSQYGHVPAHKIIHVGDKLQADVRSPLSKGIHALHYQIVSDHADSVYAWEQLRHHELIPQLSTLRKTAASLGGRGKQSDFWYRFGAEVLGPFFGFFADWVLQQCEQEQIEAVYPLMREGRFLSKLLSNASRWRKGALRVEPLYVSRQSTFLAGLSGWSKEHATALVNRRNVRIGDIFRMLELPISDQWEPYTEILSTDSASVDCNGATLKECLIDFLIDTSICHQINALILVKRQQLLKYLDSVVGLSSAGKWATVDLGFQGTMQKSISDTIDCGNITAEVTHFLAIGTEKIKSFLLSGYDIRGFVGNTGEFPSYVRTILRTPDIFEQLLMDDDCSTMGYEETEQGIHPVFSDCSPARVDLEKKRQCQKGILSFQDTYYGFMGRTSNIVVWDAMFRKELLQVIHRAIDFPSPGEAMNLGSLNTEDNFGSEAAYPVVDASSKELVGQMGPERFLSWTLRHYRNGQVCWPAGAVVQTEPMFLYNKFVTVADSQNYMVVFSRFIQEILKQGSREYFVYGAGEAGQAFAAVARMYSCTVKGFVESKESLQGTVVSDLPVMSLQQAIASGCHVYAVASFAFANEIEAGILRRYQSTGIHPIIYKPD